MGLDLTLLDIVPEGSKMELTHPVTGAVLTQTDGRAVSITLAGEDSEGYRHARRAATNRRLKSQQSGRRLQVSAEELENDALEMLVGCTVAWDGISLGDQADLPFSSDNARVIYKRLPWLREQAEAFIGDRANFMKGSPKG